MDNTAVRAEVQSTTSHKESVACSDHPYDKTHMVFADKEHEEFYYEKLSQARYQDCYHKALIYILGISADTRMHFDSICGYLHDLLRKLWSSIKSGYIRTECLKEGWQTSGSVRVV